MRKKTLVVHSVLCEQLHQDADILVQVAEHHPYSLTHHLAFLLGPLDKLEIRLACALAVCARHVETGDLAHLCDVVGHLAAAVMYYVHVNRIAHLRVCADGVYLQHSYAEAVGDNGLE